ncbi:hypothetical protein ACFQXA_18610 [Nocardiopsis composta]
MDLVITGARVVDGSGGPSYRADVGVADGRIAAIHREGAAGPRPRPPARWTPADWPWHPASSTCTPTPTWRCSATRTTRPRPPRG